MKRTIIYILPILLLTLIFPATAASDETKANPTELAALAPKDTVLLLSFPSFEEAWNGFKTLPIYQAYKDEEVQTFIESFSEGIDEMTKGLSADLISRLLELPDIFDSEAAFALIPNIENNSADWIVSLKADKNKEKTVQFKEEVLVPILGSFFPWGPVKQKVGPEEVTVFKGPVDSIFLSLKDGHLLLTQSEKRLADLFEGMKSETDSLSKTESYIDAKKRWAGQDPSFLVFFNIEALWKTIDSEMDTDERSILKASGFESIRSINAALKMAGGRASETIHVDISGEKQGFFKMFSNFSVDPELARIAPDNTFVFAGGNIKISEAYQTILAMEQASPKQFLDFRRAADDLTKKLGIKSISDLISQFGTEVVFYASMPKGGFIPDMIGAIEVLEPDKLLSNINSIVETITGAPQKTVNFKNRKIHYIPITQRGDFIEASICWCVTDGYIFLAIHPAVIKNLIRRIESGSHTLSSNAEFKSAWEKLPKEAVALGYANTKLIFEAIYGMILPFASMFGNELPFDPALLPSAEAISSYLSSGLSGITSEDSGLFARTESDGYGPVSLALYGWSVAAFIIPFEEWNRTLTRYPSCSSRQEQIWESIDSHRQANGAYPADFKEMGFGSRWMTTCSKAQQDRSYKDDDTLSASGDFQYVLTHFKIKPPESFPEDWMIIWDSKPRHNEGRIILLGNGDVTWMPESAFQKRLEKQGK